MDEARRNENAAGKAMAAAVGRAVKRAWPGATARQNYVDTGSQAHRRQVWVRFPNGEATDVWVDGWRMEVSVTGCCQFPRSGAMSCATVEEAGAKAVEFCTAVFARRATA